MSTSPSDPPAEVPLLEMPLGAVGRRDIATIDAKAPLAEARHRMLSLGISSLVVEEDGSPAGMVTQTDLLRAMSPGEPWGRVRDAMTPLIAALPESTVLPDAARQMVDSRIHRVVVTFDDGTLGIASLTDVARALADATTLSSGPSSGLRIGAFAKAAPSVRELFLESHARASADEPAFVAAFQKRFFARSPFIEVRFHDLSPERVRAICRASIRLARDVVLEGRPALARLNALARAHSSEQGNIDPQLHGLWADALIATVRDVDPEYDVKVEVAWRVVLGHLVRVMVRNY